MANFTTNGVGKSAKRKLTTPIDTVENFNVTIKCDSILTGIETWADTVALLA